MQSFAIPYAHHTCSAEDVANVFGTKLDIAIFEATGSVHLDRRTGKVFKTFEILAYPNERNAANLALYIDKHGQTIVIYKEPYFWKVVNRAESVRRWIAE